jgi:mannose-6-phosphate isomerase
VLGKQASDKAGESWEISGVEGDISVVANGFLAGNSLQELAEVYMGDLMGERIYEKFGLEFPLLIKFIYAGDVLSVQVHPDDAMARERHNSNGKTEMWYVIESDQGELIAGFNRELDKAAYLKILKEGKLREILNHEAVVPGDVYFMPAGRVHAIGAGVLLAEIQQSSDLTYRIYDWDRTDARGNPRELHTGLAADAIDFSYHSTYKTPYHSLPNSSVPVVDCPYFTTSVIQLDRPVEKDFNMIDSFVIYVCTAGAAGITYPGGTEQIKKGECVLIPAELKNLAIVPTEATTLLEVYIK